MTPECFTCKSNSGERRISPGPTIYEGQYWFVEHAYPVKMKGWLVVVLKRHAEALHELTADELNELGDLQGRTVKALRQATGCLKEYVMFLAEMPGFQHVHVHMIARASDLPDELKGSKIFAMIHATPDDAIPPAEIKAFCEQLQPLFRPGALS